MQRIYTAPTRNMQVGDKGYTRDGRMYEVILLDPQLSGGDSVVARVESNAERGKFVLITYKAAGSYHTAQASDSDLGKPIEFKWVILHLAQYGADTDGGKLARYFDSEAAALAGRKTKSYPSNWTLPALVQVG